MYLDMHLLHYIYVCVYAYPRAEAAYVWISGREGHPLRELYQIMRNTYITVEQNGIGEG